MKTRALISTLALTGLFFGCGKKSSQAVDSLNGFLNDPTGDITSDAAALAENQSDTMDELASALNESGSGGSAASALELAANSKTKTTGSITRTCTPDQPSAGKVTVVISQAQATPEASTKVGRGGATNTVNSNVSGTGTLTRVWTPPAGAPAECTNSGHFKFKNLGKTGADVNGMSLSETENRTRTMSVTKAGKTLTVRTMKTVGDRTVNFATSTDANYTYQKTVSSTMTRTITLTKPSGGTLERVKTITTPTNLTVLVKRNATTGELEKKVITAGQIKAVVAADATEVTTTFSNLTYDFTSANDNACTPVSGKISGSTFKAGVPVKAYEIDFAADLTTYPSGISIKVGDTTTDCPTCVAAKCDFE